MRSDAVLCAGDEAAGHDCVPFLLPGRPHQGHRRAPHGHGVGRGPQTGREAGTAIARGLGHLPEQTRRRGTRARA